MFHFFHLIVAYPTIFLLKKIRKRPYIFLGILALLYITIVGREYLIGVGADNITNNIDVSEENESKIHEVIIIQGDTIDKILRKQNLPKLDIQNIIQLSTELKIASQLQIGQSKKA